MPVLIILHDLLCFPAGFLFSFQKLIVYLSVLFEELFESLVISGPDKGVGLSFFIHIDGFAFSFFSVVNTKIKVRSAPGTVAVGFTTLYVSIVYRAFNHGSELAHLRAQSS